MKKSILVDLQDSADSPARLTNAAFLQTVIWPFGL